MQKWQKKKGKQCKNGKKDIIVLDWMVFRFHLLQFGLGLEGDSTPSEQNRIEFLDSNVNWIEFGSSCVRIRPIFILAYWALRVAS